MRTWTKLIWALVLGLWLVACGGGSDDNDSSSTNNNNQKPMPGDSNSTGNLIPLNWARPAPSVETYFVDNSYRHWSFTDNPMDSVKVKDPVLQKLLTAKYTIDIATLRVNRPEFIDTLIQMAKQGINIRILVEKAYFNDSQYAPSYTRLLNEGAGRITIKTDTDGYPRLMHSRFIIIDNNVAITGNYDFATIGGAENSIGDVLSITNSGVAQAFTNEFNQMYLYQKFGIQKAKSTAQYFKVGTDDAGNDYEIEVLFGPTDRFRDRLISEIAASNSIFFTMKEFTDTSLAAFLAGQWVQDDQGNRVAQGGWIDPANGNRIRAIINDIGKDEDIDTIDVYSRILSVIQPSGNLNSSGLRRSSINANTFEPTPNTEFSVTNQLNSKVLVVNHANSDGNPAAIVTTANFSTLSFDMHDEVMIVLHGVLAGRYIGYLNPTYSSQELTAGDNAFFFNYGFFKNNTDSFAKYYVGEVFANLLAYPTVNLRTNPVTNSLVADDGTYQGVPWSSALIWGQLNNFKNEIDIPDPADATRTTKLPISAIIYTDYARDFHSGIDLIATYQGNYFANRIIRYPDASGVNKVYVILGQFERDTNINPNSAYYAIVPAGRVKVGAVAVSTDGDPIAQPQSTETVIGPGGVRRIDFNVNTTLPSQQNNGGGGGGGTT